ncbi:putative DNA-binding transcriptional regulator YafY [Haloferula luteola]|uniref:Putative DNA-binding transcriptional regulator YafY n=1 Tax=Haloferula luteola TaxID=595692 RepID=A0A840VBU7_9BACT|nr:WYL domain-containing protein [Haloferula luteola]MBB5352148.1 putative DNA-binding transcriptional regulator YafY [Haloferula luteola]
MFFYSRHPFALLLGTCLATKPAFTLNPAIPATVGCTARKIAPVLPLTLADDEATRHLLDAIHRSTPIALYYQGGSHPGVLRKFQPICLYRLDPGGVVYAHGHCLRHREPRTLRLDRIRFA